VIPKNTNPLAKGIRTGEGILVYAANVALVVLGALPQGMTWQRSTLYLTILNGVYALSRSAVKMTALNSSIGIGGSPSDIGQIADPYVTGALNEIAAVESALEKLQLAPGTPPQAVVSGLSPSTPVATPPVQP
jgi:hypothetical protein